MKNQESKQTQQSGNQKIGCNVTSCMHNCIDDSTCRLDQINVTPCGMNGNKTPEGETACGSYHYAGNLNVEEKKSSLNT